MNEALQYIYIYIYIFICFYVCLIVFLIFGYKEPQRNKHFRVFVFFRFFLKVVFSV